MEGTLINQDQKAKKLNTESKKKSIAKPSNFPQKTRSLRPTKEIDRCGFGFTLHMISPSFQKNNGRWVLSPNGIRSGKIVCIV